MSSTLKVNRITNKNGQAGFNIDTEGNLNVDNKVHISGLTYTPFAYVYFTPGNNAYVEKAANSIIDFDSAEVNDGNHYDINTYKFTCPVDGLYRMELSILTEFDTDKFGIYFCRDNERMGRTYTVYRAGHIAKTIKCTGGQTLYFQLDAAEKVYEGGGSGTVDPVDGSSRYSWATYMLVG